MYACAGVPSSNGAARKPRRRTALWTSSGPCSADAQLGQLDFVTLGAGRDDVYVGAGRNHGCTGFELKADAVEGRHLQRLTVKTLASALVIRCGPRFGCGSRA